MDRPVADLPHAFLRREAYTFCHGLIGLHDSEIAVQDGDQVRHGVKRLGPSAARLKESFLRCPAFSHINQRAQDCRPALVQCVRAKYLNQSDDAVFAMNMKLKVL
jgi:hypothetical protein